jgi:tRNA 2-thiouridine synthesizing protein E
MTIFTTDENGYLLDQQTWQTTFAEQVAQEQGIVLTEKHWQIIYFAREFYQTHGFSPAIRMLLLALRQAHDSTLNSIALQHLFAHKPALMISKLAGLPKPKDCV